MPVTESLPLGEPSLEVLADLGVSVRRFRPRFHQCLLEWFRASSHPGGSETAGSTTEGLAELCLLFQRFSHTVPEGPLADLLRLTAAYLECLQRGELVADASSQARLGRIDRVLKPLALTPTCWPGADIRDLIAAFLDAVPRLATEPPSPRPPEGRPEPLSTSDFSLPVATGAETPTSTPSLLKPTAQAPGEAPLVLTVPLIESADSWLEAQAQRPRAETTDGPTPDLDGLSDLGMEWDTSLLGAAADTTEVEEPAPDPFAGLGMVISADDLPELFGQPSESGGGDAAMDALFAESSAAMDATSGADTLPELHDQPFKSSGEAEVFDDQGADPMAGLGAEPVLEPLPELRLDSLELDPLALDSLALDPLALEPLVLGSLDLEPLELEPREPEPAAPVTDALVLAPLSAELGALALPPRPADLQPLPVPAPPTAESGHHAVVAPLPIPLPIGAEVPPVSAPAVPSLESQTHALETPVSGPVPPAPRPRPHPDTQGQPSDLVAELGLNCARLAQRNGQIGCGLAEFDLSLRQLRRQLRGLESATETTPREPARSGAEGRDPTRPLDTRGLHDLLTHLVGLTDQVGACQREAAELLAQQRRLADTLQDGLPSG